MTDPNDIPMNENEKLLATVEVPLRKNIWGGDNAEFIARFPRYRKWLKFWEDNYEDLPLKIVNLESKIIKNDRP